MTGEEDCRGEMLARESSLGAISGVDAGATEESTYVICRGPHRLGKGLYLARRWASARIPQRRGHGEGRDQRNERDRATSPPRLWRLPRVWRRHRRTTPRRLGGQTLCARDDGDRRDTPGAHDMDRGRKARHRCEWRGRRRRHARLARKRPPAFQRQRELGLRKPCTALLDQRCVRSLLWKRAIVAIADAQNESLRGIVALGSPSRRAPGLQHDALLRQVPLEHRREAVHVAAPIELPRELQIAVASGLERREQARRLIVVFLLPAEG